MKKNYLYNLLYGFASFIFPLITTPYISRKLSVAAIGEYSFTFSLASYFTLIAVFGCHIQGQREIAYKHDDLDECTKVFLDNIYIKSFMTILAFGMYIIVCLLAKEHLGLLLIQGIAILAALFDISWFFQGMEEFRLSLLRNLIVKIAGTVLIFLYVKEERDLWIYALCYPLSTLLGNLSLWFCLPKYLVRIQYKPYFNKTYFKAAFELFIPILSSQIYFFTDRVMMGFMLEATEEIGYYEQAQKIMRVLMTVPDSIGVVLLPRMSYLFEEKAYDKVNTILRKAVVAILGLTCPMTIGMFVIISDFIPFFLGRGYEKTVLLLSVLSPILILSGVCNVLGKGVLIPMGEHNKATVATMAGAFVNILLNVLLIRKYLSIGAAIASVIAEILVFAIHFFYAKTYISFHFLRKKFVRYFIMASVMGSTVGVLQYVFHDLNVWFKIIFSVAGAGMIYLTILLILRDEIWKDDIAPIIQWFIKK